jgi:acyl dehydratase
MPMLTPEIEAFVGREATYTAPEELSRASIRYFALAIGGDARLYTDDAFARANGYPSAIAPPTLVCETSQFVRGTPDADGYVGHRWDLPLENVRVVRGGNEYEFHRPILPEDRVTARWRIASIEEKTSRRGSPMLVVISEVAYTDARGELLATNRETTIYQPREG